MEQPPSPSSPPTAAPGTRVYVGNLAWKVHWQDLKDHMRSRGGVVTRADVFEDSYGRSRGCGIVEFETPEQAQDAIENLTDTEIFDRKIFVREDREEASDSRQRRLSPRGSRGGGGERGGSGGGGGGGGRDMGRSSRGGGGGGGGGQRYDDGGPRRNFDGGDRECKIFVGNLPYRTSWQELKDLFNEDGSVVRADVLMESSGRSRGCGTVLFSTPEQAGAAIETMHNSEFNGRNLLVRKDEPRGGGGGGQRSQ